MAKKKRVAKRPKRRTVMIGFRLSPAELLEVESRCRDGETLSECVRRLLLENAADIGGAASTLDKLATSADQVSGAFSKLPKVAVTRGSRTGGK